MASYPGATNRIISCTELQRPTDSLDQALRETSPRSFYLQHRGVGFRASSCAAAEDFMLI